MKMLLTLYRQATVVVCLNLCLVYLVYFRSETDTPLHPAWRHVVIDKITIKTPNPKCRLYWCFIEFID